MLPLGPRQSPLSRSWSPSPLPSLSPSAYHHTLCWCASLNLSFPLGSTTRSILFLTLPALPPHSAAPLWSSLPPPEDLVLPPQGLCTSSSLCSGVCSSPTSSAEHLLIQCLHSDVTSSRMPSAPPVWVRLPPLAHRLLFISFVALKTGVIRINSFLRHGAYGRNRGPSVPAPYSFRPQLSVSSSGKPSLTSPPNWVRHLLWAPRACCVSSIPALTSLSCP